MTQKLGFWPVFALVIGSQIGSGIFLLPTALAPYGLFSLVGLTIAGLGALILALVFAQLCAWLPKTGGPHVYIQEAFGPTAAFFTGWTYWVVCWVGSTTVVMAAIRYLMPLLGAQSSTTILVLQIGLLLALTGLNLFGVQTAGRFEFFLAILKAGSLLIIPLLGLAYFSVDNFIVDATVGNLPMQTLLSQITLLSLWGFIGIESATASAESVNNPGKTIPLAIVLGTIFTALLYLINSASILGVIPGTELMNSTAPFADVVRYTLGGTWHLLVSFIAAIICISSLNVWILTSGQIALGLAQDGLLPQWFGKQNKHTAPFWSLIISCLGIIPLLILASKQTVGQQIETIIGYSVTPFLFIYLLSCLALLKISLNKPESITKKIMLLACGLIGAVFCSWVIAKTSHHNLIMTGIFALSGLPFYVFYLFKKYTNQN